MSRNARRSGTWPDRDRTVSPDSRPRPAFAAGGVFLPASGCIVRYETGSSTSFDGPAADGGQPNGVGAAPYTLRRY